MSAVACISESAFFLMASRSLQDCVQDYLSEQFSNDFMVSITNFKSSSTQHEVYLPHLVPIWFK